METVSEVCKNILDYKTQIVEVVKKGENLDDFLENTLDKSPNTMEKTHLEKWKYAFENAMMWENVTKHFKNFIRESDSENDDQNEIKINKEKEVSVEKLAVNNVAKTPRIETKAQKNRNVDVVYDDLEEALIVIEFYTESIYGKLKKIMSSLINQ